jgi:DNA primase
MATVSTPIPWDGVVAVEPGDCTIATVPARFAEIGDLHAGIDDAVFAMDELLEWAARDEAAGEIDTGLPDDEGPSRGAARRPRRR